MEPLLRTGLRLEFCTEKRPRETSLKVDHGHVVGTISDTDLQSGDQGGSRFSFFWSLVQTKRSLPETPEKCRAESNHEANGSRCGVTWRSESNNSLGLYMDSIFRSLLRSVSR